ncbi:hypothetical protein APR03_003579 [Promicromonospora thailandica]|uniref:DUF8094 domain-containing protein n=1 Tax=Promicromonospora thailandica TaxID=765201 RepID=A0A9X2GAQ4_9MICO|nr:hypothetical protein [Promicromonospora thailandica]MCP2266214.1 hypothetical protein [Promicromonospora thailandica]
MNPRRSPLARPGARPRARRRPPAVVAGLSAAALLLAGCTVEPPAPEAEAPVIAAVVSAPQEREILDSVVSVLEGADGAGPLASRLAGPALTMREAELAAASGGGGRSVLTDLALETQQLILPAEQGWPRSSFAITEPPEDRVTPLLAVLDQRTARDQYKLWAYVWLVSGATMPQFAPAELGSEAVAADDASLLVPPGALAEQYASVLTVGDRSQYAAVFAADDDLRKELRESGRDQVAATTEKDGKGRFEVAYEPADGGVKAVRTVDGGAMVVLALRSQETLRAEEGWQLTPASPSAAALWDDGDGTDVLRTAYHDTVALYVPPAGSAATVSLLGVHRVPYAVSAG